MNRIVEWFARNPVAANLVMVVILAGGLITAFNVKQEVFPEISLDLISITVEYRGAAPEEVEEGVCVRIEEAIQGLEGIKKVTSRAAEGVGTVVVELERDADVREVLDDVKTRIDAIDTFPEETEKPVVREVTMRRQVINVAISGEASERTLKAVGEQVRDEIASIEGITQVELTNVRPYEVSVEVSEEMLRRHGITFDFVANAVRRSSLDLPGGSVRTDGGEILLRAKGQAYRGEEFEDLVLLTRRDGTQIRLGDVATVRDAFAETDQMSRFDGKPSALVEVFRTGDQAALEIASKVKAYVAEAQRRMPEGIVLTVWQDNSKVLRDRLDVLVKNGAFGFFLVFMLLALFLRFRLAFWVAAGIPVAFLGAIWLMPGLDISLNLMSLFAFIIVLGMVVDDAIVVSENVFKHQTRSGQAVEGAIRGTQEVLLPVNFAVLTTIAAFVPLLLVEGPMGKIMAVVPLIVIPCLLFSLLESMLVLPSHLAYSWRERPRKLGPWGSFQSLVDRALQKWIQKVYRPFLAIAIRWRYLTLAVAISVLVLAFGIVKGGVVRFLFFPSAEADYISAAITMPQGTPVAVTSAAVARLEESAQRLRQEIHETSGADVFRHVSASIGAQPYRRSQAQGTERGMAQRSSAHLGEVTIELAPAEVRSASSDALAKRWRELAGSIPDALELDFSAAMIHSGEDINVQLTGPDIQQLAETAGVLKKRLDEYEGVHEIADSFREGKKEVKLAIRPAAELLGLSLADLARQVRQAFYGEEAQRIQRGRDDVRVMVRYPEAERRSLGDLEKMRIRTPARDEVPFSEVAEVRLGRGYATITRIDRHRAVNVTAKVDAALATPGEIVADLDKRELPRLMASFPGVRYSFEGQQAEQRDTLRGLERGFMIALIAIFALLAVPLKSYFQPLLIMMSIPFGFVGAVLGHLIMGLDLTILSLFGLVAVAGVVVNDGIVLVDFINRYRAGGHSVGEAACRAGPERFRPILLTATTTFAGLMSLMLEKSFQAQFLIPMAVSLAFGVIFCTAVSLLLIPSGYVILEDLGGLVRKLYGGGRRLGEEAVVVRAIGSDSSKA
ncbi:MAG: efflux RND transporter permease subunit [Planctomycetota bacterium]